MATIKGGVKLERALAKIAAQLATGGTLRVGFLENATYPDGKSVAMIAAIQDGGAPSRGIPPRPFFRNMITKSSPAWPKQLGNLIRITGYDANKALELMGDGIKGQLQQSIMDTNSPPLARSTLRKRGVDPNMKYDPKDPSTFGAKPLVDTGHMLNSVDFEVVKK